ncbi:3-isopropylmalate dehydrogenase [candidate division WOR-3 bacterium RBG_13_43_14]|uniref:3-isopropylmalate dehydrogenase n=1 Tax=candidate division WOR-3 bacterium RBG_13_43_14 TaxID=1802590 RepID=A0A1F4UAD6_UNCW3|nr:MAG: 3-isopropylmalate dehydrogenase [candidate division WOR-3 bacterium RBG_13_43_14]
MAKYRIAWLPGDGIGKDVLDATRIVLDALKLDAEYVHGDIGWDFWCKEGDPLPQRTIDMMKQTNCAMFGAITSKPRTIANKELDPDLQNKNLVYRSPIVRMRQLFDLYICKRPCKAYPGNSLNYKEGIDLVIFRENTEDLYSGYEFNHIPDAMFRINGLEKLPRDAAISIKVNTPKGCHRIIKTAFDFARSNKRRKVTCVHKANVVRASDGLFLETFNQVASEYSDIQSDDANVDSLCQWILKNPFNYDVLVAPNLYGDIISDLCAQMTGGLGFGSSGNVGEKYAVFEPTHGSAPKYTGMYKVNPIATILAAKMMLEWIGEYDMAVKIENAIRTVVKKGEIRTYDMGGAVSTLDMARAVVEELR